MFLPSLSYLQDSEAQKSESKKKLSFLEKIVGRRRTSIPYSVRTNLRLRLFCLRPSRHSRCDGSSDRSFMVDPMTFIFFQPVLHDWCNKGCDMCCSVGGIVHIKEPLLLIEKRSSCSAAAGFLSLSEWSFTICPT